MKINFLGTGTSQGIPVISCGCEACLSKDPRDKRLRCSVSIKMGNRHFVIDVGPDFRQQMLQSKATHLDFVLLTHEHNDHVIGADDLRPFIFRQRDNMTILGESRVLDELKRRFAYAFDEDPYPGAPKFNLVSVDPKNSFIQDGVEITPVRLLHGNLPILGYRINDFAYLTDTKSIPENEFDKLKGLKVLVLNALRKRPHHSHLNIEEAIQLSEKINPEKTYLTHFSHDLGPVKEWEVELPHNVFPAFDGLNIEI